MYIAFGREWSHAKARGASVIWRVVVIPCCRVAILLPSRKSGFLMYLHSADMNECSHVVVFPSSLAFSLSPQLQLYRISKCLLPQHAPPHRASPPAAPQTPPPSRRSGPPRSSPRLSAAWPRSLTPGRSPTVSSPS